MTYFKGKQFKKDIIIVAVGYYLRYNLIYREVSEIMSDRGITVCHTTIYHWVQEYSQIIGSVAKLLLYISIKINNFKIGNIKSET